MQTPQGANPLIVLDVNIVGYELIMSATQPQTNNFTKAMT